jgi:hypothetical protein
MRLPRASRPSSFFFPVFITIVLIAFAVPSHARRQQSLVPSSSDVKFGKVAIGNSASQVVDVTNTSQASVTVSAVSVSGAQFSVSGVNLPVSIGPGQTIPLSIIFAPAVTGWMNEQITFTDSASNTLLHLIGAGTGVTSQPVTANPAAVSFGSVAIGSRASFPVVLSNARSWNETINSWQPAGTGFLVTGPALPLVLSPGQSVTVNVSFAPQTAGLVGGTIFVSGPNIMIPVNGTGASNVTGQLTVSPNALNFGSVAVGSSTTQPSSVSAIGGAVTISSAKNSNAQYTISGISLPLTVPAGQTVGFDVIFSPTQSGTASGTLTFVSNASNSQSGESVTGAGTAVQHSVDLSWVSSTSSVAGYNVYRGVTAGAYSRINSGLDPTTVYTDKTIASGSTYYYAATAVNASGQESGYSMPIKVTVP